MSAMPNLLAQKQQLLEQLEGDPGPNVRERERLLAKIGTALAWLDPNDPAAEGE
jgi:hypothetical protein